MKFLFYCSLSEIGFFKKSFHQLTMPLQKKPLNMFLLLPRHKKEVF